jgi:hypothetical protein
MNKLIITKVYRNQNQKITGIEVMVLNDNDEMLFKFPVPYKCLAHLHNIEEGREIKLTCAY